MGNFFCRGGDSESQTRILLERYIAALGAEGCTLTDDCIRTWLYVQNVDVNYGGVVKARREVFEDVGLTKDTHYIASTGIAGRNAYPDSTVIMDAYAVAGLQPGHVRYLYGSTHLNPTYEYGVTFERGTSITYGDRKHIFISGTASIDNKGKILHEGDVKAQAVRMMENISALLAEAGASADDIKSAILYLRDASDYASVSALFKERWPMIDPVFVQAPVCRPGWLVEMECVAALMEDTCGYPSL
jgi:enamine deaminase RidA (YjgF/YER057c/UK114 family)